MKIEIEDIVKIESGPHEGKRAKVLEIYEHVNTVDGDNLVDLRLLHTDFDMPDKSAYKSPKGSLITVSKKSISKVPDLEKECKIAVEE